MSSTVRRGSREVEHVEGVVAVDLGEVPLTGVSGVVWGLDSSQLNANLVSLAAGESIGAHINDEVDQLLVVQVGAGVVVVDGVDHLVDTDSMLLIPRGSEREIRAERLMAYLSIHVRRGGLKPQSR